MRIAVATSKGESVDLHFGQTEVFYIFSTGDDTLELLQKRKVTPLSTGDKNHPFDSERFEEIHTALKDCAKVYCTKIGDKPRQELVAKGIEPVIHSGPLSEI